MAQKQFLFGQKRNSGEEKKKRPAYLRASQTEQVWVQQMQTQFWNPQHAIHPSRDKWTQHLRMLLLNQPREICFAAYPKQTPTEANFDCGKFSHGKVFPTYNFELFFSFVKGRCIVWEPVWRGGVPTLWNVDPEQKRCCPRSFRDS